MWKNIFGGGNSHSAPERSSGKLPSQGLQQTILKRLCPKGVPTLPQNARLVFEITTTPNPDTTALLDIIEQDESLTARVLKVANSAYFNRGPSVSTPREALTVIGTQETCSMLSAGALENMLPSPSPLRGVVWRHNTQTAVAAKVLSAKFNIQSPSICFTAGLLHDLGKLLFIQRYSIDYMKIWERSESQGVPIDQFELEEFSFNHCEVGATIATAWNFAKPVISAIGLHHQSWDVLKNQDLPRLVKLADIFSYVMRKDLSNKFTAYMEKELETACEVWSLNNASITLIKKTIESEQSAGEALYE